MRFDFNAARAAGYSDDEIAEYLGSEIGFDSRAALKSGYSSRDILDYLRTDGGVTFDSAEDNARIGAGQASLRASDNAIIKAEDDRRAAEDLAGYFVRRTQRGRGKDEKKGCRQCRFKYLEHKDSPRTGS